MPGKIKGFDKAIQHMKAREKDFAGGKPYKEAAKILSQSIATNVNVGGRPSWPPRKGEYSHPILDETGEMRDKAEQSALTWEKTSDGYVDKVISTGYGYVHQYRGVKTKIGETITHIIRKFVAVQPDEEASMMQKFRDAFLRK